MLDRRIQVWACEEFALLPLTDILIEKECVFVCAAAVSMAIQVEQYKMCNFVLCINWRL